MITLPGDPYLPPGCSIADCDGPSEPEPDWENMDREAMLQWLDDHGVDVDGILWELVEKEWDRS